MNRVQEAIAQITGLDTVVDAQEQELQFITDTMEHLISDNQMLQRQIEDLDYLNLFEMNQIQEVLPIRDRRNTLLRLRRLRHDNPLAKQAVKLIVRFTLGKGVQWVLASEPQAHLAEHSQPPTPDGSGEEDARGPSTPAPPPTRLVQVPRNARAQEDVVEDPQVDGSDQTRTILTEFWNDPDNKLAFTTHKSMQQMLDDMVTDGEKFYACFEGTSAPYVKVTEIPVEEISDVIAHPDNRLKPVFYKRHFVEQIYDGRDDMYKPQGNPKTLYYWDYRIEEEDYADILKKVRIPKGKIAEPKVRHVLINEIQTKSGKRGLSDLYSSREWFRVFREFMEGRAAINAAAQAISYLRKIKGSPSTVARFSGKLGNIAVGNDADTADGGVRRLTRPAQGAIYDSNEGIDLEWMKTDTGAQNAKEDARLILMSAGAGVGTMVHYFGEGGDANLATAQSMELPMVKSYEDWQQFIEDFFLGWFEYVLRKATTQEEIELQKELTRIGFTFPPIISQDVVKYTTSWSQIVRDIAPNNMAVKKQAMRACLSIMGVPNIDGIMPEIEAEMAHAEQLRIQQQQALLQAQNNLANATANGNGNGNGQKPPVAGQIPNAGADPNFKRLASGKPPKEANGPKPG